MSLAAGTPVTHRQYGPGRVLESLGLQAIVDFFGERKSVAVGDLHLDRQPGPGVVGDDGDKSRIVFRRAFEAINLGVVPPHPDQLLTLSVGLERLRSEVDGWLSAATTSGLCKVVFGDYGTGKSHHLRTVEALALRDGWVVAFVEFDPKQADPAKPHLVYRSVMASLKFPRKDDGSQASGFRDMIREVRSQAERAERGRYLSRSPWFEPALRAVRCHPHSDEREYCDTLDWLAGQPVQHTAVRALCRSVGTRLVVPPAMPRSLDTSEIYVYHLVVINELCRLCGYKGLLILLDEAEHVRGYSTNRRERANNFFDLLARSAHRPASGLPAPRPNEHGYALPKYWREGPHFGLVVALTEGDTFNDTTLTLYDACVFAHRKEDVVRLRMPTASEYRDWCLSFLQEFQLHYPGVCHPVAGGVAKVADALKEEFQRQNEAERNFRLWVKLATLVPSLLLARRVSALDDLCSTVRQVAREASGRVLPWQRE